MNKRSLLLGVLSAALLLSALPSRASAAITYDGDANAWTGNPNNSSFSSNETVPSGSNQILFVVVSYQGALPSMTVSWNGVSMNLSYTFYINNTYGTSLYDYVYTMTSPADGTYAVRVQGSFSKTVAVADFSYSGVNTGTPFGSGTSSVSTGNESTTLSYNPQYSTSTEVVFSDVDDNYSNSCSTYSDSNGATVLATSGDENLGSDNYHWYGLSQHDPINTSSATSDTVGWNCNPNEMLAWVVELVASVGTPTKTSTSTVSPTLSLTYTKLPTGTVTQTLTYTSTRTPTVSATITLTPTLPAPIPTNTPTATFTNTPLPTVFSGLAQNMRPYGLEYVPFPTVVTSTNVFYPLNMTFTAAQTSPNDISGGATSLSFSNTIGNTYWGAPVNTARWHIVFQNLSNTVGNNVTTTAFEVAVETRIGLYGIECNTGVYDQYAYSTATALSLPSRPQNYSPSYFWVGVSYTAVPYTERFDAAGDPRFEPYADELDYTGGSGASAPINDGLQGGYNWFWRNFADTSSTYVDGMQDAFYQKFIPSAQFDHYSSNEQNIDIPKLYRLIREGVMKSNGVYSAMTGWDSYYSGQGGEIGGDTSNDFQGGVPCYGGPWGSTSNSYTVDEIIGGADINGAVYVVSGTASTINWMSLPFLGELWPDSLYASQWEGWSSNNGGNATWGNLKNIEQGGSSYRVMQQDLPTSASPYFLQTLHRNNADGCASFENGTNDGSTPFNHNSNTENAALLNDGTEMSSQYNFSLPSTFNVTREWGLTLGGNTPPEWSMDTTDPEYDYPGRRTHLDVYSAVTYTGSNADNWGFYNDPNNATSTVDKSAAAIRTIDMGNAFSPTASGNPAGGWFIVNGLAPSTQSGINFVAQFAILSCLRTFADAGVPTEAAASAFGTFTNGNNTYIGSGIATGSTYRIPPIPLVTILHPTNSDPVAGMSTITIKWDERYARWDGNQYDENYPCLDANVGPGGPCSSADVVPNPALEWHDPQPVAFNVIYNIPSGVSPTAWYSALTGAIVPAGPANNYEEGYAGNYMDGADAILPGSAYETSPYQYSLAWLNVAPADYNLQVECFRLQNENSTVCYPHYAYHQITINTVP